MTNFKIMPRNPATPVRDFFAGLALLVGLGVLFLLLWIVVLVVLATLVFAGLTVFTDWNFGARVGCGLVASFIFLKVLGFISNAFDLIPKSWIDAKPCPKCGKNLRTSLAQQCMHCGADWHVKSRAT